MQYERERKGFLRRWGWTLVFAVVILGAAVAALVLPGQPLGRAPSTPPPSAVAGSGETQFTRTGIDYAIAARTASLNLSGSSVPASRLGLSDDDAAQIVASELGMELTLIRGGEHVTIYPIGGIAVASSGGVLDEVRVDYPSGRLGDARAALFDLAPDAGLDGETIEAAMTGIRREQRDGRAWSAALDGALFGFPTALTVDCDAELNCRLTMTLATRG